MERSRRKRKLTEKFKESFLELSALKTEVKEEPPEEKDPPPPAVYCCLCKTTAGTKLLWLFGRGPKRAPEETADKIAACVGLEITPEVDQAARICRGCLRVLDRHDDFRKQALHCNDYAQNRMADDEAELGHSATSICVCRFCLKIGGKLTDMCPAGSSPDEVLLQKIRLCLTVEINPWDPVTKICQTCLKKLDELSEFREAHSTASVFVKQEDEKPFGLPAPLDLQVSDEECLLEDPERCDPLTEGRKLKVGYIPLDLLELLGSDVKGRNFTPQLGPRSKCQVTHEGHPFKYHSREPDGGSSVWHCVFQKIHSCQMILTIGADGMEGTCTGSTKGHSHSTELAPILRCPLGKGTTTLLNGVEVESFLVFCGPRNDLTRWLLVDGYRYYLEKIRSNKAESVWYCGERKPKCCKLRVVVLGIFEKIDFDGEHSHKPIPQKEAERLTRAFEVDPHSSEAIRAFQQANPAPSFTPVPQPEDNQQKQAQLRTLTKEKNPEVLKLLVNEDIERNFTVVRVGSGLKVELDGFGYRYQGTFLDGSTAWRCLERITRKCLMIMKVSVDGTTAEWYYGRNHKDCNKPLELFSYPTGKRTVDGDPLWLLARIQPFVESRTVVFRGFMYVLFETSKAGSLRWLCTQNRTKCRANLLSWGDFEKISVTDEHTHSPVPQEHLDRLTCGEQKRIEEPIEPTTTPDNATLRDQKKAFFKKLRSFSTTTGRIWDEAENKFETFHIVAEVNQRRGYFFVFRGHRFGYSTATQRNSSRWLCSKCSDEVVRCPARVYIEGVYESVVLTHPHNHDPMPEVELQRMLEKTRCHLTPAERGEGVPSSQDILDGSQSKTIYAILSRHDPQRNFSVHRENTTILVKYEGEDFRLRSREKNTWSCIWAHVRVCPAGLQMNGDCKTVQPIDATKWHNHTADDFGIYQEEPGKIPIFDEDKNALKSCFLFNYQSEVRTGRAIIYQGHKLSLLKIGNNKISTWRCRGKCPLYARIETVNEIKVITCKYSHTDERLTDEEIMAITGADAVDPDLLPSSEDAPVPLEPTTIADGLRLSDYRRILLEPDPKRNFTVLSHRDDLKIQQNGYEYYYMRSEPTHSLWKCVHSIIRSCRVRLHVDNAGRYGTLPKFPAHNHSVEPWDLFSYPLGESSVMDTYTETVQPFWFLMEHTFMRPKPTIIYGGHRYKMVFITESGDNSKWACLGHHCKAKLNVTGLFELVVDGGVAHYDPPMPEDRLNSLIAQFGTPPREEGVEEAVVEALEEEDLGVEALEEEDLGVEVLEEDDLKVEESRVEEPEVEDSIAKGQEPYHFEEEEDIIPFVEVHMAEWYGELEDEEDAEGSC